MNCQDCRDHFGELLYASRGEPLEGKLAESLAAHLRECPECAGELQELQRAQSWLDVLNDRPEEAGTPPEQRRPQIALYARLAGVQRRRNAWRYAALAASTAAAVLLVNAWRPRPAVVEDPSGAAAQQASVAPTAPPFDWGPEFQRLAQHLDEQDALLRLLAAELRSVEDRQGDRLMAVENQAGNVTRASDLQSLRVAALQHDIDRMREFLTARTHVAQQSPGGSD